MWSGKVGKPWSGIPRQLLTRPSEAFFMVGDAKGVCGGAAAVVLLVWVRRGVVGCGGWAVASAV